MKQLNEMSLEELWQLFPIILKEHNPDYSIWYSEEKENLVHLLTPLGMRRINHIGSTSVERLIAKPIVDILAEFPLDYNIDTIAGLLLDNGWLVMAQDDPEYA